jgi:hypothetical protein
LGPWVLLLFLLLLLHGPTWPTLSCQPFYHGAQAQLQKVTDVLETSML